MGRQLRTFSRPRATTSETLQKTIQSKSLLRPGPRFNPLMVGVLAKAQRLYGGQIHTFVALANHWHLLATFESPKQMADFHRYFNSCLSKEAGIVHDWNDVVFPRRYHHVELSDEPEVELARLRYLLGQGCKEGLVASPLDWPGVSSTEALVTGEPMKGVWVDRTALGIARRRGEDVSEADFSHEMEVRLTPPPSLAHLSSRDYRALIVDLVREIEQETAAMHARRGTTPLGPEAVLKRDPHHQPAAVERSPRPWFHTFRPEVRQAMRAGLLLIVAAYRDAAERLKGGERDVRFPEHTFPPSLPFVENVESLAPN